MPINYEDILTDIQEIAASAPQLRQELEARQAEAKLLLASALDQQLLKDKITKAVSIFHNLRCAIPTAETINQAYPLPDEIEEHIIIAVDGSQINPSRHLPVNYFLLNLGIITYPAKPDQTPLARRQSSLFSYQSSLWKGINEDRVAYLRDIEERKVLSEEARIYGPNAGVITLTDGPLELWLRKGQAVQTKAETEKSLAQYLDSLVELHDLGALTAGYVDKPRASLVIESLEILKLEPGELDRVKSKQQPDYHKFEGVTDRDIFSTILVNPGDRSAVFELQFSEASIYKKRDSQLALHFFYLNVSREPNSPVLARVEIPAWVAADPDQLALLQSTLFKQCNILGDVRYPYVLHRSHEEAVVTFEDREELDRLIIAEFARNGIPISDFSNKQTAKNLPTGKRRYNLGTKKY